MRKKDALITYLVFGILICAFLGALGLCALDMSSFEGASGRGIVYNEELITFSRDWKLSAEGFGEFLPGELPFTGKFPAGTRITAVNTLPSSVTEGTYVAFRNLYSFCEAYVGDEHIYSSPVYVSAHRAMPVPGWVFVPLKAEYSARTISIVMECPYACFSGTVPAMLLGTHAEILLYSRDSCYFDLYIALTVTVLGIVVMLFAFFNMPGMQERKRYMLLGLFITSFGAALMCGTGLARLSGGGDLIKYMGGRMIYLLCPLVYTSSMCATGREKGTRLCLVLAGVSFLTFIACVLSHFAGWAELSASSRAAALLMLCVLAVDLYLGIKDLPGKGRYYRIITAAGTASLAGAFVMGAMPRWEVYALYTHVRYMLVLFYALAQAGCVVYITYTQATERALLSKELAESRMKLMMSQIQPHFVQNTLSTIRAMIPTDPGMAYDMIYDFADYLRYNINSLGNIPIIPFEEELRHIRAYTDIESRRYGERVKIVYDISDVSFSVPPLSVQPLVENAVKHGVCRKLEGGTVRIGSCLSGDGHTVTVEDDGAGFDPALLEEADNRGVGIRNAVYRLENQTGAKVDIRSVPGQGTKVTISIPAERRSSDENDTRG